MRNELELKAWDQLNFSQCEQVARQLSRDLPERFLFDDVRQFSCGEVQRNVAQWKVEEDEVTRVFSLVPGGEVELGFDPHREIAWSKEHLKDWAKTQSQFEFFGELPEYMAEVLTPLRRVQVRPMLVETHLNYFHRRRVTEEEFKQELKKMGPEIQAEVLKVLSPPPQSLFKKFLSRNSRARGGDMVMEGSYTYEHTTDGTGLTSSFSVMHESGRGYSYTKDRTGLSEFLEIEAPPQDFGELKKALQKKGYGVLSRDEWEHACSGGTRTLFRWGDLCPGERLPQHNSYPFKPDESYQEQKLNAFGLLIAFDNYITEPCMNPERHVGGDGGESIHTGFGNLVSWLALASSYQGETPNDFYMFEWVRRAFPIEV